MTSGPRSRQSIHTAGIIPSLSKRIECSDLVVVGLGVLHRLEADGHNGDGWWGQVFDHGDQVAPQGLSLHLAPADRLTIEL